MVSVNRALLESTKPTMEFASHVPLKLPTAVFAATLNPYAKLARLLTF